MYIINLISKLFVGATNGGLVQEGKAKVLISLRKTPQSPKVIFNNLFIKRVKRWHSNIPENVNVELSITLY